MKPLLLVLLLSAARAQHDYQNLMDYLENRLLAIEDRMLLWRQEAERCHSEMKDFQKLSFEAAGVLKQQHAALLGQVGGANVQVERLERQVDYVETWTTPRACSDPAHKVLEQEAWGLQESRVAEEEEEEEEEQWEELQSTVSDCDALLSGIRSVKILSRVGGAKGGWSRDPRSSRVYVFNGTSGDSLLRFDSVRHFSRSAAEDGQRITLPSQWAGPGAVFDDFLYYVRQEADGQLEVVKYDLLNRSLAETAIFPVEGPAPVYRLNPETAADLAADGEGLWLLFAPSEDEPTISLAKMDAVTLDIEQIWDTRCPRWNAEAAFVVCGTVYVAYNTRQASRSRVQCVFDVEGRVSSEEAPLLYFPRRFGAHASLKYNAAEQQLYAWDDGYQIIYRLAMRRRSHA